MKTTACCLLAFFITLTIFCQTTLASDRNAQSVKPTATTKVAAAKNTKPQAQRLRLEVTSKKRFFFGEPVSVTFSLRNTSSSPVRITELKHQLFTYEVSGIFSNDEGKIETHKSKWDGRWIIPEYKQPANGETIEWLAPTRRPLSYITLLPGKATKVEVPLSDKYGSLNEPGRYKIKIRALRSLKASGEFEIYFDKVKSVAALTETIVTKHDYRPAATYYLENFSRPILVGLLKKLVESDDQEQRKFAADVFFELKQGRYDSLRLILDGGRRYYIGQSPSAMISFKLNAASPQTLSGTLFKKAALELTGPFEGGLKAETRSFIYAGDKPGSKSKILVRSKNGGSHQQVPSSQKVKILDYDDISLWLDLAECFGSKLGIGKYKLTAKAIDEQAVFREQTAVSEFEVYYDQARTPETLTGILRYGSLKHIDYEWAVITLAKFDRLKLISALEGIAKSSSWVEPERRNFANTTLEKISAGYFDK